MPEIWIPHVPPALSATTVKNGRDPRGATFQSVASMLNWILGRGGQLIPAFTFGALAAGAAKTLQFTLFPNRYAYSRIWVFNARPTGDKPFVLNVSSSAGGSASLTFTSERSGEPQMMRQTITSPTDQQVILNLTLSCPSSSGAGFIDSVQCFEAPRAFLNTTESKVTDEQFFAAGRPINNVVGTLLDNLVDVRVARRRPGLFYWGVDLADAFTTTSTTYVNIFELLQHSAIRAYGDVYNDGRNFVNCRVYARATGGSGTYQVTTTSGNSQTRAISGSGAWGWISSTINTVVINIDTEDIAAVDGRRLNRSDELTHKVKADAGGTTIDVATVFVGQWKQAT